MDILVTDNVKYKSDNKDIKNEYSDYQTYSKKSLSQKVKSDNHNEISRMGVSFVKNDNSILFNNSDINSINGSNNNPYREEFLNKDNVKLQKDYLTVMSNTMSDEDFARLKKDGYDPVKDDIGEMVNVSDRIKATMLESGKVIKGYNDDLDIEDLSLVTGNSLEAVTIYKDVSNEVNNESNMSNEERDALDKALSIDKLSSGAIHYMVLQDLKPNISNLYMAEHSYSNASNADKIYYKDSTGYMNIKSQVEADEIPLLDESINKIMESNNIESTNENQSFIKEMINDNLPVTDKSFRLYKRLKSIDFPIKEEIAKEKIANALKEGLKPADAVMDEEKTLLEKALDEVNNMKSITDEAVISNVKNGKPFNLRSLYFESKNILNMSKAVESGNSVSESNALKVMNEIRISMTVSSTYILMKNDIDVNMEDLNLLAEDLKEANNRQFEAIFGRDNNYVDSAQILKDTNEVVSGLKNLPVKAFGITIVNKSYSLNMIYREAKTLENEYLKAGKSYESLSTEIRRDLGDSINKAFGNIGEILDEENIEKTEENMRAARILGYNSMEINPDNVRRVNKEVNKVLDIINKMTPRNVINLIRDGVNPIETDMDKLIERLDEYTEPKDMPKLFSEYLVKLDERKAISEEERESYIGIFRMINTIKKNDMSAVGSLINMNADINFKNLLSVVRSKKAKGMDLRIGDGEDILLKTIKEGASISDEIGKAFVNTGYDDNKETRLNEYEKDLIEKSRFVSAEITEFLVNENIPQTIENLVYADNLLNKKSNVFGKIKDLFEKENSINEKISKENEIDSIDKSAGSEENVREFNDMIDKFSELDENYQETYSTYMNRLSDYINDNADLVTDINSLRELSSSLNALRFNIRLAENEMYEVPIRKGDEISSVTFRLLKGDKKGISLSLTSEEYGLITGRFEYQGGNFEGRFYHDNAINNDDAFDKLKKSLMEKFDKENLPVKKLDFLANSVKSGSFGINVSEFLSDKISKSEEAQGRENMESTDAVSKKTMISIAKTFIETIVY